MKERELQRAGPDSRPCAHAIGVDRFVWRRLSMMHPGLEFVERWMDYRSA